MRFGFIHAVASQLIEAARYLNLVELFKAVAARLAFGRDSEVQDRYRAISIDVYVVVKWAAVALLWAAGADGVLARALTIYLLATNVYTYFYFHLWDELAMRQTALAIDRLRRRFVNLFQAFAFSIFAYAYLYDVPYAWAFDWKGSSDALTAIYFSAGNAFTVTYGDVVPTAGAAKILAVSQLAMTFLFVIVILARTISGTGERSSAG